MKILLSITQINSEILVIFLVLALNICAENGRIQAAEGSTVIFNTAIYDSVAKVVSL